MIVTGDRDAYQLADERQRADHDHLARHHRHARLRPRGRGRALRHPARAGHRLHRAEGRHLGQHPRRPGHRRQDRRAAAAAVRVARGACSRTSTRSPARSGSRTCARTPTSRASRRSSRPSSATSTRASTWRRSAAAEPDRSRLREVFKRFELRDPLRRLEEALGEEAAAPRATGERRVEARARESAVGDLASCGGSRRAGRNARGRRDPLGRGREGDEVLTGVAESARRGARRVGRPAARRARLEDHRRDAGAGADDEGLTPENLEHDTMVAAYLIDPARRRYPLDELLERGGHRGGRRRGGGRRSRRRRDPRPAPPSSGRRSTGSSCRRCWRRSSCRWSRCSTGWSARA